MLQHYKVPSSHIYGKGGSSCRKLQRTLGLLQALQGAGHIIGSNDTQDGMNNKPSKNAAISYFQKCKAGPPHSAMTREAIHEAIMLNALKVCLTVAKCLAAHLSRLLMLSVGHVTNMDQDEQL